MVKICFIVMQKDEGVLLDLFVRHHTAICGYENIYILDNGSKDDATLAHLNFFEKKGVNVIKKFSLREHFNNKGQIILNLAYDKELFSKYDFIVPIDCDELFALELDDQIVLDKEAIHGYLSRFIGEERALRVSSSYKSFPGVKDEFHRINYKKIFLTGNSKIQELDIGFHGASMDDNLISTDVVYLNFHNRTYIEQLKSARNKSASRVGDFSRRTLEDHRQKKKAGFHLMKYFLQTRDQYYNYDRVSNAKKAQINFESHINEIGGIYPFLKINEDSSEEIFWLKNSTNMAALNEEFVRLTDIQKSEKLLTYSFGMNNVKGFTNGMEVYNKGGYGWIDPLNKLSGIQKGKGLFSQFVSVSGVHTFKIEIPNGTYK